MFACNTRCKLVETPCVLFGLLTLYCSHKYTPGMKALLGAIQKASFVFLLFDNARSACSWTNDILHKVCSVIFLQVPYFQSELKSFIVRDILHTKSLRYNASYYRKWTKCRQRGSQRQCVQLCKHSQKWCRQAQLRASFQHKHQSSISIWI